MLLLGFLASFYPLKITVDKGLARYLEHSKNQVKILINLLCCYWIELLRSPRNHHLGTGYIL